MSKEWFYLQLDEIMKDMKIPGRFIGDVSFEILALVVSVVSARALIFIESVKYIPPEIKNKVVLTIPKIAETLKGCGVCACEKPRIVFFKIHNYLSNFTEYKRARFNTKIGINCKISPLAFISDSNVKIGDRVVIEEFVSIKENTEIGDDCIIRAGSIIGGEGFEHKRDGDEVLSVKHLGGVIIGSNVEIQQLNTVDKALYPWDNTMIGDYCKTDNLVYISHAVKMKKRVFLAAKSIILGRAVLEDDVWIGPGASVINGITVKNRARVNIGSVATRDVPEDESVTGNFAIEHSKFIRNLKELNRD
jgi:UDP-3-O-[3-hydroxymyristoyl] glucosamine N-acyltransferase